MTVPRHLIALVLVIVGALMALSSAAAQYAQVPRTAVDLQAQVQKSAELQRQALQSLPDVGRAEPLITRAYDTLQAAMSSMVIKASGAKSPDPLLNLNEQRMRQALLQLQQASDAIKVNRPPSETVLGDVRKSLEQALRLTGTVFIF